MYFLFAAMKVQFVHLKKLQVIAQNVSLNAGMLQLSHSPVDIGIGEMDRHQHDIGLLFQLV